MLRSEDVSEMHMYRLERIVSERGMITYGRIREEMVEYLKIWLKYGEGKS